MAKPQKNFALYEGKDLIQAVCERIDHFRKYMQKSPIRRHQVRALQYYHGQFYTSDNRGLSQNDLALVSLGEQGELVGAAANKYKRHIDMIVNLITQVDPTFRTQSANTDNKSNQQAILSDDLLAYYAHKNELGRLGKQAALDALLYGVGYVSVTWDPDIGEEVGTETVGVDEDGDPITRIVYKGDLKYTNINQEDIYFDPAVKRWCDNNYLIVREQVNKWDLAEKYPDQRKEILQGGRSHELQQLKGDSAPGSLERELSDHCYLYHMYHKKTESVPKGRYICWVADTPLIDIDLPYHEIPIYPVYAGHTQGTQFGYTVGWPLCQLQEIHNMTLSSLVTNVKQFGIQNLVTQPGSGIDVTDLENGMNLIEADGDVRRLDLLSDPSPLLATLQTTDRYFEEISGVTEAAMGQSSQGVTSGKHAMVLEAKAHQSVNNIAYNIKQMYVNIAESTIKILQKFGTTERVISIIGKSRRGRGQRYFVGQDDLQSIDHVRVEIGNPITKALQGKQEWALGLLDRGLLKNIDQIHEVMETGRTEELVEYEMSQLSLIKTENEDLQEGKSAQAAPVDKHQDHIREHSILISHPEIRKDPEVLEAVLAHIKEHYEMLKDPGLAEFGAILQNAQPVPPAMPPQGPPPPGMPDPQGQIGSPGLQAAMETAQQGLQASGGPPNTVPQQPSQPGEPVQP